jgi:hypothetical protein
MAGHNLDSFKRAICATRLKKEQVILTIGYLKLKGLEKVSSTDIKSVLEDLGLRGDYQVNNAISGKYFDETPGRPKMVEQEKLNSKNALYSVTEEGMRECERIIARVL